MKLSSWSVRQTGGTSHCHRHHRQDTSFHGTTFREGANSISGDGVLAVGLSCPQDTATRDEKATQQGRAGPDSLESPTKIRKCSAPVVAATAEWRYGGNESCLDRCPLGWMIGVVGVAQVVCAENLDVREIIHGRQLRIGPLGPGSIVFEYRLADELRAISELSECLTGSCYRLYFLPAFGRPGLVITLTDSDGVAQVHVTVAFSDVQHDRCDVVSSCGVVPEVWRAQLGTRPILPVRPILRQLEEHGIWNLPACSTNSRDGFGCLHIAATRGRFHDIWMHNPQCHENPAYTEILNTYSDRFVDGVISVRHMGPPD